MGNPFSSPPTPVLNSNPATEQLLGIPDAFAWCWAKGGHWRSHIRPVITVQTV